MLKRSTTFKLNKPMDSVLAELRNSITAHPFGSLTITYQIKNSIAEFEIAQEVKSVITGRFTYFYATGYLEPIDEYSTQVTMDVDILTAAFVGFLLISVTIVLALQLILQPPSYIFVAASIGLLLGRRYVIYTRFRDYMDVIFAFAWR